MAFSVLVEMLNLRMHKKRVSSQPVRLRARYTRPRTASRRPAK
jgi:hypothetical protein